MGLLKTVLKQILEEGTVIGKEKISDAVYKISIENENISKADFMPGYFLRVAIGVTDETLSRNDFVRSYSVWNIDKEDNTLDLAIATHSNGAGARWVTQLKPGDKVFFRWKKGKFVQDDIADSYLMIGDISALSHLYVIKRNLPFYKQVNSIIYGESQSDFFNDIDNSKPFDFYKLPNKPILELIHKINEILPAMMGEKMVYIGGDSRICVALNRYFKSQLHWQNREIKIKPFWNPDKKGLE